MPVPRCPPTCCRLGKLRPGPRSQRQPEPERPRLPPGHASSVHPRNKGFLSSEHHCWQGTLPPLLHILSWFNMQSALGEVGTIIPITGRRTQVQALLVPLGEDLG